MDFRRLVTGNKQRDAHCSNRGKQAKATWINIDEIDFPEIPRENHTVYPSRGDILLYPGYRNDQETLIGSGPTYLKSPAGELAGNHIATIDAPASTLKDLEDRTLHEGSFPVTISIE